MDSMEDFRSRSYGNGSMAMEAYGSRAAPSSSGLPDFRSYSTPHAPSNHAPKDIKFNKGKSTSGSSSSASSKGVWCLSDPELQRKKRVAGYKAYAVEGKLKGSLRKSFRWLKDRYTQVLNGRW